MHDRERVIARQRPPVGILEARSRLGPRVLVACAERVAKFVTQDSDELQLAARVQLEASLVDEHVARGARFVREECAREIVAIDIDRPHVEDHRGICRIAIAVLCSDVDKVDVGVLFPLRCCGIHLRDDVWLPCAEGGAHAIRELLLLLPVPLVV